MKKLVQEREKVLSLRRKGYTYQEILKEVPVSKSSISLWLAGSPLTEQEKLVLKERKDSNITKGRIRAAASIHMRKAVRDGFLFRDAKRGFDKYSSDPFFQLGIGLYWAEGAKRNSYFAFSNSDPEMVSLMIRWVRAFLSPNEEDIRIRLHVHKSYASENCEGFWSEKTGIPLERFSKSVLKPTTSLAKRRPEYKGCARLEIYKMNYLLLMKYWQQMLIERYRQ